jgi:putative endonuclease
MSRDVEKMFYVYLVADRSRVLYVGFTSNLRGRVIQHREGWFEGFTKSYDCHRLVWFERFSTASAGIAREKQIKRWATGEEGGSDRTGKSDLGGFVAAVGGAGGVVSVA